MTVEKRILTYRDFLFEQNVVGSRTIEEAINVAKTGKVSNQNFIDFLMTPLAKRLAEAPWILVSTDKQLRSGTFMFKRIDATNPVSIGIFKTGYIRVVPDDPNRPSHPVINYTDLIGMNLEDFTYKSSMDPSFLENLNPYIFMAKHLENNLDMDGPASEFPKFLRKRRGIKKGINFFEITDKNGNMLAECPIDRRNLPSIVVSNGKQLVSVQNLAIQDKEITGAFFTPDIFDYINMGIFNSNVYDSVINVRKFSMSMKDSGMIDCVVNTGHEKKGEYDSLRLSLHNSEFKNVKINNGSGASLILIAEGSVLDGSEIEMSEIENIGFNIEIENCSVKGLKFPKVKREKVAYPTTMSFVLEGLKLSDSEDLSDLAIEMLNSGPPERRINAFLGNRVEYRIKNCDFSGVNMSRLDLSSWETLEDLPNFAADNKNFDIDSDTIPVDVRNRMKRIIRANDLFGED